jgi:dipeptidyl-peptidase-4
MIKATWFSLFSSGGFPGTPLPKFVIRPPLARFPLPIRFVPLAVLLLLLVSPLPAQSTDAPATDAPSTDAPSPKLLTVAERSDFRATARHADVLEFAQALSKQDPRVKYVEFGKSVEGRALPLVIVAPPDQQSPAAAAQAGKPIVLLFANIHAGEVDGKEALLMLTRDLLAKTHQSLLSQLVLLVVPNLNPDGNERFDRANRPQQDGPAEGMGIRENAQGLDLNRDYIKLESPEIRALVRLVRQWQPHLVVDCHTTNGSWHRHTITYDANRHPAGNSRLIELARHKLLPAAASQLLALGNWQSFYYGNFNRDHTAWETFPLEPRFGTHYFSLGPQLAVLVESYSHAPFRDRVLATRDYCRALLQVAVEQRSEILAAITQARTALASDTSPIEVPLQVSPAPLPGNFKILGYEEREEDGRSIRTDTLQEYPVTFWGGSQVKLAVPRPAAYLIPPGYPLAIETLQRHGIEVQQLREDIELDLQIYQVAERQTAAEPFQGHRTTRLTVTRREETRPIPAGWFVVRTNHSLGQLSALLLEPHADDGLTCWNFFDQPAAQPAAQPADPKALAIGSDFPVLRLPTWTPLLLGPVRAVPEQQPAPRSITMADLYDPPTATESSTRNSTGAAAATSASTPRRSINLTGSPATGMVWSPDGQSYLHAREGKLYRVSPATGRLTPLVPDPEPLRRSLAALAPIGPKNAASLARFSPSQLNPAHTAILIQHDNDLYHARLDGSLAVRLTTTPAAEELASFSPDGNYVAFVRSHNLFVVDVDSQTERQLTTDGNSKVSNGKADWVYYEEVFRRDWRCYWWSPDSRRLAFLRLDDTPVHAFAVIDPIPPRQQVEWTAYPKAGDPLPLVNVGVVTAAGGEPVLAKLSDYSATDRIITRATFTPDSETVIAHVLNRQQTWMDLLKIDAHSGETQRLFREQTQAWVDDHGPPEFLTDGSFLFLSERTGYKHLYHYSASGQLQKQLTSGPWEIRSVHRVDPGSQFVYFSATKDNAIGQQLYRVKLDGSQFTALTNPVGTHQISFAPRGPHFLQTVSSRTQPTRVYCATVPTSPPATPTAPADSAAINSPSSTASSTTASSTTATIIPPTRTVDLNPVPTLQDYRLGKMEPVQIPTPDGFLLEGQLTFPPDFDPERARRYPVWVKTYGGPHAPTVKDSWIGGRLEDQAHAAAGFIIFQIDPRPASGKGAIATWSAYRQLGKQELADLEHAVRWLSQRPYIDAARIGLSGYSYGGYLTCYALTHSKLFAAGVAGAPVTDWRNYDAIYTERYMDTPQDNPDGYRKSSVVQAARDLHGKLLLVHGAMDDNVHLQNVLQLLGAFQAADRYCELQIYPRARHGVGGKHFPKLAFEFMSRHLNP